MSEDVLIPLVVFGSLTVIVVYIFYTRMHARRELHQTVRVALDKGQPLSPELIDKMAVGNSGKNADLRRGVIAVAVAVAVAAIGAISGEQDAIRPTLAASVLPLAIGVAYLSLWWFDSRRQ